MKGIIRTTKLMKKEVSGFTSIVNHIINMSKFYVDTYSNFDLYVDNEEFNEIFRVKYDYEKTEYDFDFEQNFIDANYPTLQESNAHMLCNDKVFLKNKIFEKFFELKNLEIYEEKKQIYIDDKTLSVHIRGTDKINEITPPSIEDIIDHIEYMINENVIESIFLATDDFKIQKIILNEFGNLVKYNENSQISFDGNPLHFNKDRRHLNQEVMLDTYLLSQSNYFLYCFSNVSYLALTMGINNFKKINCINTKIKK